MASLFVTLGPPGLLVGRRHGEADVFQRRLVIPATDQLLGLRAGERVLDVAALPSALPRAPFSLRTRHAAEVTGSFHPAMAVPFNWAWLHR